MVVRENNMRPKPTVKASLIPQRYIDAHDIAINQKQIINARTRGNVTTCLYLSPDNRARSLSTLIALDVKIDTRHKTKLEALHRIVR